MCSSDLKGAEGHVEALLAKSTLPNLFDDHPPFQIDGNFGGCAGIAEMLLQSQDGVIDVLPAWAPSWRSGSFSGLKARGGFEVGATWRDGQLSQVSIKNCLESRKVRIRLPEGSDFAEGREFEVEIASKKTVTFNSKP